MIFTRLRAGDRSRTF